MSVRLSDAPSVCGTVSDAPSVFSVRLSDAPSVCGTVSDAPSVCGTVSDAASVSLAFFSYFYLTK